MTQRIFITADHGLALISFLQSTLSPPCLKAGVEVIMFVDDEALPAIEERFHQPGLIFEGLRLDECQDYYQSVSPVIQRWLDLLRWTGGSKRINTIAMDGNYHLITAGYTGYSRLALPFLRAIIWLMRRSRFLRSLIVRLQYRFTPNHLCGPVREIPARPGRFPHSRLAAGSLYPAGGGRARHPDRGSDCRLG